MHTWEENPERLKGEAESGASDRLEQIAAARYRTGRKRDFEPDTPIAGGAENPT
jgi:hypothetical protein